MALALRQAVHAPSQMLTRLNLETRSQHAEADGLWIELLSGASESAYIDALVVCYGFEAPIEAAISLTPGVQTVLALRPRARSGLIVQDLLALGFTPYKIARLPQCCQIVPYRDVAEALGWLYVVERATLIHDGVRRQLQEQLPSVRAWNYLSAYEGQAGMRWQELGAALDSIAVDGDIANQIVAAARDAFATQRHWVSTESRGAIRV